MEELLFPYISPHCQIGHVTCAIKFPSPVINVPMGIKDVLVCTVTPYWSGTTGTNLKPLVHEALGTCTSVVHGGSPTKYIYV